MTSNSSAELLDNSAIPFPAGPAAGTRHSRRVSKDNDKEVGILWWPGALVAVILALQAAGPYAGAVTLVLLMLWALGSTRCAVQSLTISVLVIFANPGIVGTQQFVPLLKWVLLFVCLGRVLVDWKYTPRMAVKWLVFLGLFVGVAATLTAEVSRDPSLSLLKLSAFIAGVLAALLGGCDRRYPPAYWLSWYLTVYGVVLVLSAPFLFFAPGRQLNGTSFQGIMGHPQGFGVYLVPLTVYLTVKLFVDRGGWFLAALAFWAWYAIYASRCRTAVLAAVLAIVATFLSSAFRRGVFSFRQQRSIIVTTCLVALIAIAGLATRRAQISESITSFIAKGDVQDIGQSRDDQVESLYSSIADNPIAGVGFGLSPESIDQEINRDELTGLAVSASTEQGFLPLAVMAQVGAIGAVPLALFIAAIAFPIIKWAPPAVSALFWAAFFVNFGEMIFFSTGGLGLQMWLLFACCITQSLAVQRSRRI